MFGLIRKSQINEHIKRAEKRATKKVTKEYKTAIRRKKNELRKLRQKEKRVLKGYGMYRKSRDQYGKMSADMEGKLHVFQNEINMAIGKLRGGLDKVEYQVYLDQMSDEQILKLIK